MVEGGNEEGGAAGGAAGEGRAPLPGRLLEEANDAVLVTEGWPVEEPGPRVVYANAAFSRTTGYSREEIVGRSPRVLQGPGTDRTKLDEIRAALEAGRSVRTEVLNYRKDGTPFWVELDIVPVRDGDGRIERWLSVQRETTARVEAEGARLEAERRLRSVLARYGSDMVTVLEPDGTPRYESPAVERALGYRHKELAAGDVFRFVHPDDVEKISRSVAEAVATPGESPPVEFRMRHADGSWRWFESSKNNLSGDPGGGGIVVVTRDVTERKALEERLEHLAFHDPLTGLPNRRLFFERLEHALARGERRGERVAVLFVDLDNFKYVNDSLGHGAGDRLLAAAAERLEGCVRPGDTAARLGGDEFAVLLEGVHEDAGAAARVAERIVGALRGPFDLGANGREVFCGASVGVATGVAGRDRPEDLLRKADLALYEAKAGGKSGHALFDAGAEHRSMRRLGLEDGLRRALERGEITVRYQPVVALETGRTVCFRALPAWKRPGQEPVPPDELVRLAEELGLAVPVGRLVLREACRRAREWQDLRPGEPEGPGPPPTVGATLSAGQLSHPGLAGDVEAALRESGLDPARLGLEVAQGAVAGDEERRAEVLGKLKGLGVKLAVADFGTGDSSLSGLRRLPAGMLKIDRSFVEGVGRRGAGSAGDEALLSGVVGIAHGLGMRALAEGVETPEQAARLRELGFDLAQGPLFSGPLTGEG